MKTLSKQAERVILTAINDVVEHVNNGLNPTDAVIKVAEDSQLSRNFVNLVCTGYNTGATNFQRESGDSVLQKYADFPIADPEKVAEALWPKEVEEPSKTAADSVVSSEYHRPPSSHSHEKAAHVDISRLGPKAPPTPRARDRADEALSVVKQAKLETAQAKQAASLKQHNLLTGMAMFSDMLKQANDGELQHYHFCMKEVLGEPGEHLFKYAMTRNRTKFEAKELPEARFADWDSGVLKMAKLVIKSAEEAKFAKQECQRIATEAEKKAEEAMSLFVLPRQKEAGGFLGGILTREFLNRIEPDEADASAAAASMAGDLADPDHENEIRKIQAQTMLQDLLSNDEVISGYDPEEVMGAYNEMSSLSPRSATLPAVVRPWLRKRLTQGAMEPFEAAEMANVEKTIGQTQNPIMDKTSDVLKSRSQVLRDS